MDKQLFKLSFCKYIAKTKVQRTETQSVQYINNKINITVYNVNKLPFFGEILLSNYL